MGGGPSQDGCLPTIATDCPESSGRGGVQEGEKTWGEKTRPQYPALSGRLEIPCPSESSRGPQDGDRKAASGGLGSLWGSHSPAHGEFSSERRDTYLTLMETPWALDPGNYSLRRVAEWSLESHHSEGWTGQRTWSEIGAKANEDHASSEKAAEAPRLGRESPGLLSKGGSMKPPQRGGKYREPVFGEQGGWTSG